MNKKSLLLSLLFLIISLSFLNQTKALTYEPEIYTHTVYGLSNFNPNVFWIYDVENDENICILAYVNGSGFSGSTQYMKLTVYDTNTSELLNSYDFNYAFSSIYAYQIAVLPSDQPTPIEGFYIITMTYGNSGSGAYQRWYSKVYFYNFTENSLTNIGTEDYLSSESVDLTQVSISFSNPVYVGGYTYVFVNCHAWLPDSVYNSYPIFFYKMIPTSATIIHDITGLDWSFVEMRDYATYINYLSTAPDYIQIVSFRKGKFTLSQYDITGASWSKKGDYIFFTDLVLRTTSIADKVIAPMNRFRYLYKITQTSRGGLGAYIPLTRSSTGKSTTMYLDVYWSLDGTTYKTYDYGTMYVLDYCYHADLRPYDTGFSSCYWITPEATLFVINGIGGTTETIMIDLGVDITEDTYLTGQQTFIQIDGNNLDIGFLAEPLEEPDITPPETPENPEYDDYMTTSLLAFVVPFFFLFVPPILLVGFGLGLGGLIIGFMMGSICCVGMGLLPIWVFIGEVIAIVCVIFFMPKGQKSE